VERSAPVSTDLMKHSVISFKMKNDIKVVEFNVLYISYHVPLFCIMCPFVENE